MIAYALSFLIFIALVYWKARAVLLNMVEARMNRIENVFCTTSYLKRFSMHVLAKELEVAVDAEIERITDHMESSMRQLQSKSLSEITATTNRWHNEFESHMKRFEFKILEDVKAEMTHEIIGQLIQTLKKEKIAISDGLLKSVQTELAARSGEKI